MCFEEHGIALTMLVTLSWDQLFLVSVCMYVAISQHFLTIFTDKENV